MIIGEIGSWHFGLAGDSDVKTVPYHQHGGTGRLYFKFETEIRQIGCKCSIHIKLNSLIRSKAREVSNAGCSTLCPSATPEIYIVSRHHPLKMRSDDLGAIYYVFPGLVRRRDEGILLIAAALLRTPGLSRLDQ